MDSIEKVRPVPRTGLRSTGYCAPVQFRWNDGSNCGHLLADAVEAAAAGEDVVSAQTDRLAPWKERADRFDRSFIIGRAIDGHHHRRIADVEVHVGGRD